MDRLGTAFPETLLSALVSRDCGCFRALEIWPTVQQFVGQAALGPVPQPSNKSFEAVKQACEDPLFVTELEIFRSIAKQVEVFLLKYQTDAPVLPFLSDDLTEVIKGLLQQILKPSAMEGITGTPLHKVTQKGSCLERSK